VRYAGIITVLLAGCAYLWETVPVYIPTNPRPHALYVKKPEDVAIFMTGRPDRPFVEVGMIEVQQDLRGQEDARTVVAKMRQFAGKRGCDALAIFSSNDGIWDPGGKLAASNVKGYRGSCIVYVDAPPKAAEASLAAPVAAKPLSDALSCMPNSTQLCYGPGGCRGGQRCTASGDGYTLCDCGSATAQVSPKP
jgi:hypothetical protein